MPKVQTLADPRFDQFISVNLPEDLGVNTFEARTDLFGNAHPVNSSGSQERNVKVLGRHSEGCRVSLDSAFIK